MSSTSFQISTRHTGRKRVVKVRVYDTAEELRKAARRWDIKRGVTPVVEDDCLGICHKFEWLAQNEDGSESSWPYCAYIRLVKEYCRTGIISHECAHAAAWIYQLDNNNSLDSMVDNIEKEEEFCYALGDLTAKLVNGLYKTGILPQ